MLFWLDRLGHFLWDIKTWVLKHFMDILGFVLLSKKSLHQALVSNEGLCQTILNTKVQELVLMCDSSVNFTYVPLTMKMPNLIV